MVQMLLSEKQQITKRDVLEVAEFEQSCKQSIEQTSTVGEGISLRKPKKILLSVDHLNSLHCKQVSMIFSLRHS